jgi:hypothetical protein
VAPCCARAWTAVNHLARVGEGLHRRTHERSRTIGAAARARATRVYYFRVRNRPRSV